MCWSRNYLLVVVDNSEVTASGITETDLGDTLLNGNNIAMVRTTTHLPSPLEIELCSWYGYYCTISRNDMSAPFFLGRDCFPRRDFMLCVLWKREYWGRNADIFPSYPHSLYQVARDPRLRSYPSIHIPTNTNTTNHKTPTTIRNIEMKMKVLRQRDNTGRKRSDVDVAGYRRQLWIEIGLGWAGVGQM